MGPPIRILLLEDDPAAPVLWRTFFAGQGDMELCGWVRDGWNGLEAVDRQRPDAVLMDLILPGMDGLEFLAALNRRQDRPAAVVASPLGNRVVIQRAAALGADYYFVKPVRLQSVADLLRALCGGGIAGYARQLLIEMGGTGLGLEGRQRGRGGAGRGPAHASERGLRPLHTPGPHQLWLCREKHPQAHRQAPRGGLSGLPLPHGRTAAGAAQQPNLSPPPQRGGFGASGRRRRGAPPPLRSFLGTSATFPLKLDRLCDILSRKNLVVKGETSHARVVCGSGSGDRAPAGDGRPPGSYRGGGPPEAGAVRPQPPGGGPPSGAFSAVPGPAEGPHDSGPSGGGGAVLLGQRRGGLAGRGDYSGHRSGERLYFPLPGGQRPAGLGGPAGHLGPPGQGHSGRAASICGGPHPGAWGHHPAGGRGPGPRRRPHFGVRRAQGRRERHDRRIPRGGQIRRPRPGGHSPSGAGQHGPVGHRRHQWPGPVRRYGHGHGYRGGAHRRAPAGPGGRGHPLAAEDGGGVQDPLLCLPVRVRGDVRRGPAPGEGFAGNVHDRRIPGGSGHPGGPPRHCDHRPGSGGAADGEAGGHCQAPPGGGDSGLRGGYLLGQDGHSDPEPHDGGGAVDSPAGGPRSVSDHRGIVQRRGPDWTGGGRPVYRRPHRDGPGNGGGAGGPGQKPLRGRLAPSGGAPL